jgi:uncharacterized RDD family membrane protein YckC
MHVRLRSLVALLLSTGILAWQADAHAQRTSEPRGVERTEAPPDPPEVPPQFGRDDEFGPRPSPVFRLGGDYMLGPSDEARNVVIVSGKALISGHVYEDVVVMFGDARIADSATIDGSVVLVGSTGTVAAGAKVRRGFVALGGAVTEAPGFMPGDEHIVVDPRAIGIDSGALGAWITGGLLLGRPLVPSLTWAWIVVGVLFLLHLLILLIAERPVRRCARTLTTRPLTTFLIGLLVLLLAGPIVLLLLVSVAGILVLPFALCGLIAAWVVGKVAVMRWIGARATGESLEPDAPSLRAYSARSFIVGAVALIVAYLVPVVGIIVWGATGVLALGAAVLTFFEGYRRENPRVPRTKAARALPDLPPAPSPALRTAEPFTPSAPVMTEPPPPPTDWTAPPIAPEAALPRASFLERLAAFALDVVVVFVVAQALDLLWVRPMRNFILLLLLYHVAFWTVKGTTIGGMICQLRLIRTDGHPLQLGDAFIRGLAGILSGVAAGLGFLWMLKKPDYETWHDRIAGTLVVKVPRTT